MNTTKILSLFVLSAALCSAQSWENWEESPRHSTAITDGNPTTTTTLAATEAATGSAILDDRNVNEEFQSEETPSQAAEQTTAPTQSQLAPDLGYGSATIAGMEVDTYTIRIPYGIRLDDRSSLDFIVPVSITIMKDAADIDFDTVLDDADVFGIGVNCTYSYRFIDKQDGSNFRWKVSPSAGLFYRKCSDLNLGSWVFNGGISSSWAWQFRPGWVVNIGNSISTSWSTAIGDCADPMRDAQQVMINGVQFFRLLNRWTIYVYVMDTRYFKDSLINNFQTYAAGTGYKLTRTASIRFTLIYDDGHMYRSVRGTLGSTWNF